LSDDRSFSERIDFLDSLSSEMLLNMLNAELESGEADFELTYQINKILNERDENVEVVDVDAAWESFVKLAAESKPIYDPEEENSDSIETVRTKPRKPLRKAFIAVAAVIAILVGSTVVANANGIELWGAIVSWTSETFGFSQKHNTESANRIIPEQLEQLAEYFDEYGISRDKLPTYIPNGYMHMETKVAEASTNNLLICILNRESSEIVLCYKLYLDDYSNTQIQKDDVQPEICEIGETKFYIMSNAGEFFVTWTDGNLECLVAGVDSHDEVIKIINSIYGNK